MTAGLGWYATANSLEIKETCGFFFIITSSYKYVTHKKPSVDFPSQSLLIYTTQQTLHMEGVYKCVLFARVWKMTR